MQRICNNCRVSYQLASDGILICGVCGNQSPGPSPDTTYGSESSEIVEQQSLVGATETAIVPATTNRALIVVQPSGVPTAVGGSLPIDQRKSPGLAALLSFLLVGMGQIYLGQVEKGLCMLGVVLLLIMSPALGSLGLVILFLNVLDAFLLGRRVKAGHQVTRWQFFFQSK
jgi:TM2 domain-containing membrane protein YozV